MDFESPTIGNEYALGESKFTDLGVIMRIPTSKRYLEIVSRSPEEADKIQRSRTTSSAAHLEPQSRAGLDKSMLVLSVFGDFFDTFLTLQASVPESVPENGCVQGSVPRGFSGTFGPNALECPLSGHFLDTPERWARRSPETPRGTLPWTRWRLRGGKPSPPSD